MYKVGDIFYLDDKYAERAEFCNQNNLIIVEIEADGTGRRFQIQEPSLKTQEEQTIELIIEKKQLLQKYKEDVEQVDLFGMERADYQEKKTACANLVLELRELESSLKQ